jgi:hypothetical protein
MHGSIPHVKSVNAMECVLPSSTVSVSVRRVPLTKKIRVEHMYVNIDDLRKLAASYEDRGQHDLASVVLAIADVMENILVTKTQEEETSSTTSNQSENA